MTSAAEFVEGGVQDPCDDACSICLESFCEDDPVTVTSCKHEYHLQCILEWAQRSKECPMCWQPLSLKDPDSQELLTAVEQERALRRNKIHASSLYHPSPIEEYEFHRFASYGDEDCIMQHLAAAAMGRAHHHMGRREQIRFRPSTTAQGPPHFVLVSGAPAGATSSPAATPPVVSPTAITSTEPPATVFTFPPYTAASRDSTSSDSSSLRQRAASESEELQHGTTSSELHSLDSFKSRLVAASSRHVAQSTNGWKLDTRTNSSLFDRLTRYKESLTKSTRGFRERLRTRSGVMQDLGARAREMSAGVVRALERMSLEPADGHDLPHGLSHTSSDPTPINFSHPRDFDGSLAGGSTSHTEIHSSTPISTPTPTPVPPNGPAEQ